MRRLRTMQRLFPILLLCLLVSGLAAEEAKPFAFAAIGDMGCDCEGQDRIAKRMLEWYSQKPFQVVLMLGDNIYARSLITRGGNSALFPDRFDKYYKPLIDRGVKFYAVIGNHDVETRDGTDEIADKERFNIQGEYGYYTFTPNVNVDGKPLITFYALNSSIFGQEANETAQIAWLSKTLTADKSLWKIPFFHHPIYAPGGAHDPEVGFRNGIEKILVSAGVRVTFSGHDHFYARMKPQGGIVHFISGGGGETLKRPVKTESTAEAAEAFHFMYLEVDPNYIHFWAIPATGPPIDQGAIAQREQ